MTLVTIILGIWVFLMILVWAFSYSAGKISEKLDFDERTHFEFLRNDARARSVAFNDEHAESPGDPGMGVSMELRPGRIQPTGEVRWPSDAVDKSQSPVWTRGASDPRRESSG